MPAPGTSGEWRGRPRPCRPGRASPRAGTRRPRDDAVSRHSGARGSRSTEFTSINLACEATATEVILSSRRPPVVLALLLGALGLGTVALRAEEQPRGVVLAIGGGKLGDRIVDRLVALARG